MEFCGADVYQRGPPSQVEITFETFTLKLDKSRGAGARPLQPKELHMFRGLLCVSHAMPALGCAVSLLQGEIANPMVP